MKIEELQGIIDQITENWVYNQILRIPISPKRLEEAIQKMEPLHRERLYAFVGKTRKDWGGMVLPKHGGGNIKQGYANVSYALTVSVKHLIRCLKDIHQKTLLITDDFSCPHCGGKLEVFIEKRKER